MNVFNKVTLQSLKKNRTRTIVTIIGIILSTAMICAVTTSIASLMDFGENNMIYARGDWHGSALNVEQKAVGEINGDARIESSVTSQILGYSFLKDSANSYKPYLYVLGAGEGYFDRMPIHIVSGRLPENSTEIIVPEHLSDNGGITYKAGDKITLGLGDRTLDGEVLGQNNGYLNSDGEQDTDEDGTEIFTEREKRSYTVVGVYERPSFEDFSAPGYTAITVMDGDASDAYLYNVYYKMNKPKEVYTFLSTSDFEGETNRDVLMFQGVSGFDGFYTVLCGFAAIIIMLIVFGSVSLIYNAFSISVAERTKQFGLLSSIGATKKQIKKSVFFEAIALSVVGIPLGILSGLLGIGVTLTLLGDRFMSLGSGFNVPMKMTVSVPAIIAAVILAFITVLISARIPSKRAMKVTAVEAIRQTSDFDTKGKSVKTSKLTYKLFGLPGMLATKYFKRSRRRYRSTIISLFMSVVLFVSASSLTGYLTASVRGGFDTQKYDIMLMLSEDEKGRLEGKSNQEVLELLEAEQKVTGGSYSFYDSYKVSIAPEYSASSADGEAFEGDALLCFVDDASFEAYVKELKLDESVYLNAQKPVAVAVEGYAAFNYTSEKFETEKILKGDNSVITAAVPKEIEGYRFEYLNDLNDDGDWEYHYSPLDGSKDDITLSAKEALIDRTLTVGKLVYDAPAFLNRMTSLTLVYPYSATKALGIAPRHDDSIIYTLKSEDHAESYKNIASTLVGYGVSTDHLVDAAAGAVESKNIVTIINVFSYGFIVLISLIAAANVFNTVSTNIGLRRREFAMLKSVGMTAGGMNKMMNFECLLYGSRALLAGLPVSVLVTFAVYMVVNSGFEIAFTLPWAAMGIASLSVFIVVFATMMYSMRKIKKDNPIDALKNENL